MKTEGKHASQLFTQVCPIQHAWDMKTPNTIKWNHHLVHLISSI